MQGILVNECPCCGSEEIKFPFQLNENTAERFRLLSRLKYGGFMDGWETRLSLTLAQCERCAHIWHYTRPDQDSIFNMYAQGKRLNRSAASTNSSARIRWSVSRLFDYCTSPIDDKSFLDFGSGAGRWSAAAQQAGFHVTAYEPVLSRQSRNGGIEVVGALAEIEGRRFNVINLEQVLEHVPYPAEVLRTLERFCYPDTVLRISVPDVQRLGNRLWLGFPFNGENMHILSPFEHLHGFRHSSLTALLKTVGLKACADWRLGLYLPDYVVKRCTIGLGLPFSRTMVLARFSSKSPTSITRDMKAIEHVILN